MSIDHIFPVSLGFDMGLPPELIADPRNIQFITLEDNLKKRASCDSIPVYIQQWMIGYCQDLRTPDKRMNQLKGIERAKKNGTYTGRKSDTKETLEKFLSKPKNKQVVEYLNQGLRGAHISRIMDVNPNTISKIKKVLMEGKL
jgi:DNA invertase Pin-like site-specific DNA recombinase